MFPEGKYQTVKAGEVLNGLRNGLSPSTHGQYRGNVLTLTSVTQGQFDPTYYKEGMFDIPPPQDKLVSSKDFYICRGNGNKSLVGVGVFSETDRPDLIFPDTVIAATVDFSKICLPYLFYAWRMPNARQQIEKGAKTTNGTYKINQKLIESIEIPLPPLSAQKEFAAFIEQLDKSVFVQIRTDTDDGRA